MLLRFICRAALSNPQNSAVFNPPPSMAVLSHHRYYSKQNNNKKQDNNKNNKSKSKSKPSDSASSSILQSESATSAAADDSESTRARARLLSIDERDPSLDAGPNNRPLFTSTTTLSSLTRSDACTYFKFRLTARAPYQINNNSVSSMEAATAKPEITKPWPDLEVFQLSKQLELKL